MGVHGFDLSAFVAVRLKTDALVARDAIAKVNVKGVEVRDVYLLFGDIDLLAAVHADCREDEPSATQLIAQWVSRVRDRPEVASTTTYVIVSDPRARKAKKR